MRNKIRFFMAALAAVFCFCTFPVAAYAGGGEDIPEEIAVTEATEEPVAETEPNPFTPDGTGTVLDNATDGDGKEFFTITTEAGNIFYLIIDRQRDSDNVYFLNAVTEADLMALAEQSGDTVTSGNTSASTETPESTPEATPEPEVETPAESGGSGGLIFILIAALACGGAGWYFKIYKPKQQAADPDEEFEDEYEDYEDGFDGDGAGDYEDETYDGYSSEDDDGGGFDGDTAEPDSTLEE